MAITSAAYVKFLTTQLLLFIKENTEGSRRAFRVSLKTVGKWVRRYRQAGLEGSLDDYLRGLQGNPTSTIWWDQLLYGTPPPGLDVRLSLDLDLQKKPDKLIGNNKGAAVLLNAKSGEILVLASHPTYDPNKLNEIGTSLTQDNNSPLIYDLYDQSMP